MAHQRGINVTDANMMLGAFYIYDCRVCRDSTEVPEFVYGEDRLERGKPVYKIRLGYPKASGAEVSWLVWSEQDVSYHVGEYMYFEENILKNVGIVEVLPSPSLCRNLNFTEH